MAYSDREKRALRNLLNAISFPAAVEVADRLITHQHDENCPSWNGQPEFTPAHCPNAKENR